MIIFDDIKFYKDFIACRLGEKSKLDAKKSVRQCINRLYNNNIVGIEDKQKVRLAMLQYESMKSHNVDFVFAMQEIKEECKRAIISPENRVIGFSVEEIYYIWELKSDIDRAISLAIMFLCKYFNRKNIFVDIVELKRLVGITKRKRPIDNICFANGCYYYNKNGYRKFFGYKKSNFIAKEDEININMLKSKILPIEYKYCGFPYLVRADGNNNANFISDLFLSLEFMRNENLDLFVK